MKVTCSPTTGRVGDWSIVTGSVERRRGRGERPGEEQHRDRRDQPYVRDGTSQTSLHARSFSVSASPMLRPGARTVSGSGVERNRPRRGRRAQHLRVVDRRRVVRAGVEPGLEHAEGSHVFVTRRDATVASSSRKRANTARSSPSRTLDAITGAAAYVGNDRLDILATNQLARALFSELYAALTRPANFRSRDSASSTREPKPSTSTGTVPPKPPPRSCVPLPGVSQTTATVRPRRRARDQERRVRHPLGISTWRLPSSRIGRCSRTRRRLGPLRRRSAPGGLRHASDRPALTASISGRASARSRPLSPYARRPRSLVRQALSLRWGLATGRGHRGPSRWLVAGRRRSCPGFGPRGCVARPR